MYLYISNKHGNTKIKGTMPFINLQSKKKNVNLKKMYRTCMLKLENIDETNQRKSK